MKHTLPYMCIPLLIVPTMLSSAEDIKPTWESLAANYHVPDWFVDGKLGVWFHWGIPSSIDENRPHDGSHYGAWMYGTEDQLSAAKYLEAVQRLTNWHNLTTFGRFMKINGEGIYGTRPWKVYGEGPTGIKSGRGGENHTPFTPQDIRFTTKAGNLYAFVLAPPTGPIVIKTLASGGLNEEEIGSITMLGSSERLRWDRSSSGLTITLPRALPDLPVNGFVISSSSKCETEGD